MSLPRLHATSGSGGEFLGRVNVAGPIFFADAPQSIQDLFNDPLKKVTQVVVFHRDLNTDTNPKDRFFWSWTRMPEKGGDS